MCGRFTQTTTWDELARLYRITEGAPALNLPARYNVLPGTDVALVRVGNTAEDETGGREIARLRWGFRPPWKKERPFPINARAETLFGSGMWREAARRRRCVIPANGFFEPVGPKRAGRPQEYFQLPGGETLSIAGVWTRWPGGKDEEPYDSFAVVTAEPDATVATVHWRMPALLDAEAVERWLDPALTEGDALGALLRPWGEPALEHWNVGQAENHRNAEGPKCIAPVDEESAATEGAQGRLL